MSKVITGLYYSESHESVKVDGTTGYRLISVDKSCAVALVDSRLKLGDRVAIQIRKKTFPGTIVKKKFYDKHYKK